MQYFGQVLILFMTFILSFSCDSDRISELLELEVRFPSVMMKMPCQCLALSQAQEAGEGPLVHLKLKPEEGAGAGAEARIPAP